MCWQFLEKIHRIRINYINRCDPFQRNHSVIFRAASTWSPWHAQRIQNNNNSHCSCNVNTNSRTSTTRIRFIDLREPIKNAVPRECFALVRSIQCKLVVVKIQMWILSDLNAIRVRLCRAGDLVGSFICQLINAFASSKYGMSAICSC